MFDPTDLVFVGDKYQHGTDQTIQPACLWIEKGTPGPAIIVNPLSGNPQPKRDGSGDTYRGDRCVQTFRHCLLEFDDLNIEDQVKFWSAIPLPIQAVISTGGKSLHVWVDLSAEQINTLEAWEKTIEVDLYDKRYIPLGVDKSCKNAAQLSRLPGVLRAETGRWQRLLWLSERGRHVSE
jgi:hypothetical protein